MLEIFVSENRDQLVHVLPLVYWIQLISIEFNKWIFLIIFLYSCFIITNLTVNDCLLSLVKSKKICKEELNKKLKKFFKENKFLMISASLPIFFGFITSIIIIFTNKDFLLWNVIIGYYIGIVLTITRRFINPVRKRGMKKLNELVQS